MFDIESIKLLIVGGVVAFISSGAFYQIIKLGIKKLTDKLTGTVGALKEENVITQDQHDKFVAYITSRDDKLIEKIGTILDKIPEAEMLTEVRDYFLSIQIKIDEFLNEVDTE